MKNSQTPTIPTTPESDLLSHPNAAETEANAEILSETPSSAKFKKKDNKWIIIGSVVTLVFILLGGVVFGYQKYTEKQKATLEISEELSGTEVDQMADVGNKPIRDQYIDKLFGFSLSLPENVYGLLNSNFVDENNLYFDIFDENDIRIVEIRVHPEQSGTYKKDIFTQKAVLGGQSGLVSSSTTDGGQKFTKYDVINNEKNYLVYFYGENMSPNQKQILSTFKFVEGLKSTTEIDIKKFPSEVIFNEEINIESKEPPKGWTKYESDLFSIYYPTERRVYDQSRGSASPPSFSLCPVNNCQDAEMIITENIEPKSLEEQLLIQVSAWEGLKEEKPSYEFQYKIFPNFSIGSINGIAHGNVYKEMQQKEVLLAKLPANGKVLSIFFDRLNPIHLQILETLQLRSTN